MADTCWQHCRRHCRRRDTGPKSLTTIDNSSLAGRQGWVSQQLRLRWRPRRRLQYQRRSRLQYYGLVGASVGCARPGPKRSPSCQAEVMLPGLHPSLDGVAGAGGCWARRRRDRVVACRAGLDDCPRLSLKMREHVPAPITHPRWPVRARSGLWRPVPAWPDLAATLLVYFLSTKSEAQSIHSYKDIFANFIPF